MESGVHHPRTGRKGIWVSSRLFQRLDIRDKAYPSLNLQIKELKLANENLVLSLDAMTETATASAKRAQMWKGTALDAMDAKEQMIEDVQKSDPWLLRIGIFGLGLATAFGAVWLAQGL